MTHATAPFGQGNHCARNVYGTVNGERVDIGRMDHAEDAKLLVDAGNAYVQAGPGHHVMVTVDEARNHGSASISRRMVPLYAPIGLLLAGDTEDTVREEYDLTEGELRLVAALTEDIRGLLAERESKEAGQHG